MRQGFSVVDKMMSLADSVIAATQQVAAPDRGAVALHEPEFRGREWEYVRDCIDTGWVSSVGSYVDRFEAMLTEVTGAKYAVAVVNGTAALHAALLLVGVRTGDEVLIPALTFVATANAVTYCGAIPHFVDGEERTLGLDPKALREYLESITSIQGDQCMNRNTGRVIRALIPVHTFGHPVDIEGMQAVARDFHLVLVEDAAESLGSTVHGRHTGTFGLLGVLSFNGNKTITTGGGGAILTDDLESARRAKHLTTTARVSHRWEYLHDDIGYNYRLPNLNAALGCAQLEQLPDFLAAKRNLFQRYQTAFAEVPRVRIIVEPEGCRSNYWLQTLLLDESVAWERDAILSATNAAGLMTRPTWTLMHQLVPYRECPKMNLTVAESLARRIINLPSSSRLGMDRRQ
mgnify:CR=1 FL=1